LRFFNGVFVRFSTRGVQKHHKKLFGGNTCQKLLAEKVEIFFVFPFRLYPALLCVSQQGEFKNTIKHFLGEIHVKNFWQKKLRKKNFFPFVFSHRFFFIAFLAVSLNEEPKNTIKIFSQIRPENLKKSQKGR
jgi:hypothetical protein